MLQIEKKLERVARAAIHSILALLLLTVLFAGVLLFLCLAAFWALEPYLGQAYSALVVAATLLLLSWALIRAAIPRLSQPKQKQPAPAANNIQGETWEALSAALLAGLAFETSPHHKDKAITLLLNIANEKVNEEVDPSHLKARRD